MALAGATPVLAAPSDTSRIERLRQHQVRVADVTDRLSIASHERCRAEPQARPIAGGAPSLAGDRPTSAQRSSPVAGSVRDACVLEVTVVSVGDVNAWADGRQVWVSSALIDECRTNDDLALVIAHELAHNLLRHRQRLALPGSAANTLLPVASTGSAAMRETEEDADRLAVALARAAGYDLGGAVAFVRRLLEGNGASRRAAATHPASDRRLALLSAAIHDNAGQATPDPR